MPRFIRSVPLALTLALGLGVASCAIPPVTGSATGPQTAARLGSVTLTLHPRISEGQFTQAIVNRPTSESITRLVVIPMVETSPGQFQPFRADGTPTTLGDGQAISVTQTAPALRLSRSIQLTGLAPHTKYRILARAYNAQDRLLSTDATSTLDVSVTDDNAPTSEAIPVTLANMPFAARTTIILSNGASADYSTVETSLVTVSGSIETPVLGTTQTLTKAQMPMILTLDGLLADTTYRLNAVMRDASSVQVATASVEIVVTNDDAPTGKTLTLKTALPELQGIVTTIAGSMLGYADGTGTAAKFYSPLDAAVDAEGNLFIADSENHRIRKITPGGVVSTVAGGTQGYQDGTGTAAKFDFPGSIAVDAEGNLFVTDYYNDRIRKIAPGGVVSTVAGGTRGYQDGTGTNARFNYPSDIAIDAEGNLYVPELSNHRIRKITPGGAISTVAGSTQGYQDGTGTNARFNEPSSITVDPEGNLYVTDTANHRIRKITPGGAVSTVAGSTQGYQDGTGTNARFNRPVGIAFNAEGDILYVMDTANHRIRQIQ